MAGKAFRKRSVEVRAIRWTGDNIEDIFAFMAPEKPGYMSGFKNSDDLLAMPSGWVAEKGDWIVCPGDDCGYGVMGHEAFEAAFEPTNPNQEADR
jgi:hypothetical protein